VPAAAVIPAPIAYIKVVAVKKLVVGFLACCAWPACVSSVSAGCAVAILLENGPALHWVGSATQIVYFEKIRVFKAGNCSEYISME
jgi:hypothetical protein